MLRHSLLLTRPRHLEWVEEDLPPLQPCEVLVQTTAGAISIGAELPQFLGTARTSQPTLYPHMTGYESIGKVIACGSQVQHLQIGNRVVAFYRHRTAAIVAESKAIVVPDAIPDSIALLAILTCDVAKGIRKLAPQPDMPVLVMGAGTIGLLTTFVLKMYGIQTIDVIEPIPERCALALQLGASHANVPPAFIQQDTMYAQGFECSSHNEAFELLQQKITYEGRICTLADGNIEPLILTPTFYEKELTITGSSDGWDYQEHAKWYFSVVPEHINVLEQIFDARIRDDCLISTFEQMASGIIKPVKVLVEYKGIDRLSRGTT